MHNTDFLKQYVTVGKFEISDVISKIYYPPEKELQSLSKKKSKIKLSINNEEFIIKMNSDRYKVFAKNNNCYICKLPGSFFLLQRTKYPDKFQSENVMHFNLYAEDKFNINSGKIILMTVDHVKPKSKGGTNFLENLQTCCVFCNTAKDSKLY